MDVTYNQPTIDGLNRLIQLDEMNITSLTSISDNLIRTIQQDKANLRILKALRRDAPTQPQWDNFTLQINNLEATIQDSETRLNNYKKQINTSKNNIVNYKKQIKNLQIQQQQRPLPILPPPAPPRAPLRYLTREEREREIGRQGTAEPIFIINSPGQGSSTDPLPPQQQPLTYSTLLSTPSPYSTLLTLPPQPQTGSQGSSNDPPEGAFVYEEEDDDPVSGSGSSLDLDKLKKYALSDGDIEELLGEDIFICVYPYLNEVEHIDQIFDDKGRCMLLFNTINDSAGHWVCMHKKKDRIDFFDPYGLKPDEPMKWLTEEKRDDLDMETRRLTQLLKSSGYKVYYNTFEFQSDKHSNTCGRWCASRLLYLNYDLDQFYQFINHYKNKYELGTLENAVTYLTYEIINK